MAAMTQEEFGFIHPLMTSRYDEDVVLWSEEQARALRGAADAGWNAPIDWEHVAEEIEGLGISERRTLASHLAMIVEHLLKLQTSPAEQPARGWKDTIRRARRDAERLLAASPSLQREIGTMIEDETKAARALVRANLEDYDEQPLTELEQIRYTEAQMLGDWMPRR